MNIDEAPAPRGCRGVSAVHLSPPAWCLLQAVPGRQLFPSSRGFLGRRDGDGAPSVSWNSGHWLLLVYSLEGQPGLGLILQGILGRWQEFPQSFINYERNSGNGFWGFKALGQEVNYLPAVPPLSLLTEPAVGRLRWACCALL